MGLVIDWGWLDALYGMFPLCMYVVLCSIIPEHGRFPPSLLLPNDNLLRACVRASCFSVEQQNYRHLLILISFLGSSYECNRASHGLFQVHVRLTFQLVPWCGAVPMRRLPIPTSAECHAHFPVRTFDLGTPSLSRSGRADGRTMAVGSGVGGCGREQLITH